eukprot:m.235566 g.235566  ORF g.235566 m.235566 type:complete len:53 (+) comp54313_c0_seq30:601-759(+)
MTSQHWVVILDNFERFVGHLENTVLAWKKNFQEANETRGLHQNRESMTNPVE